MPEELQIIYINIAPSKEVKHYSPLFRLHVATSFRRQKMWKAQLRNINTNSAVTKIVTNSNKICGQNVPLTWHSWHITSVIFPLKTNSARLTMKEKIRKSYSIKCPINVSQNSQDHQKQSQRQCDNTEDYEMQCGLL